MPFRDVSPTNAMGRDGLPLLVLAEGTELNRGYVTHFLAAGGMSVAYRGSKGVKTYFVKEAPLQDEQSYKALLREKDLIKRLTHPRIPCYYEDFEQDGFHYLVTEFISGATLENHASLAQASFPPQAEVVRWGIEICDILAYLHGLKPPVIYRDLKPKNLMRREDGKIYLVDFGIARTFKASANKDTRAMGTALTASPEHFSGQTDARSDVYSLGATLHILLARGAGSGIEPFEFAALRKVNPSASEQIEAVISKSLQFDPKKRYSSVTEFKEALNSLIKVQQVAAPPPVVEWRRQAGAEVSLSGGGGVKPRLSPPSVFNPRAAKPAAPAPVWKNRRIKNLATHLTLYSRQLATLVNSGMALVRALDLLALQCEDPNLQEVLHDITKRIESGSRLSQAFSAYPQVFPEVFVSLITIGENTGQASECLNRLALLLERQDRIARKVKSALTYPAFVLCLSTILALLISWTVLPNFMSIFESMKVALPLPTVILMFFASTIRKPAFWLLGFGLGLLIVRALKVAMQSPERRMAIFAFLGRLPLLGPILEASTVSRYCWVMEGTLGTGLELIRSLKLAGDASGSPVLADDSKRLMASITEGWGLAQSMKLSSPLYPRMLCQLVQTGEEMGNLAKAFKSVAVFYDEELDYKLDSLTAALEPLLMAVLAILVGGVVIAIFLPLYGFITNLGS